MKVKRVRVGDVLELHREPVQPDPDREFVTIGVRSFGKGVFHYEPKLGNQLGSLRFFRVEPGQLVISNIKGWEGAVATTSEADRGCLMSNRFLSYRPVNDEVHIPWAKWFFLSEAGLPLIQHASPGSADRNRTLAIERFENLEIPLPPIDEQRHVAARLDRERAVANSVSSAFLASRASDVLSILPDLSDAVLHRRAASSARVGDVVSFVSDIVLPAEDPFPAQQFVGLQHIESHTGRRLSSDPLGQMKGRKFRFRPGDIVYGYLRPYLNKVWVADCHGLCSVDQYVLRPHAGMNADLLAFGLRGRRSLRQAVEMTHSLQLPRLRTDLLKDIELDIVSTNDVGQVVAQLESVRHRTMTAAALRRQQQALADALLPSALNEAFNGLT